MRLIDADAIITALIYDEEHEETQEIKMSIADFLDSHTVEGCPQNGGWISVKDRLPEKQTPVLVYVPPYNDKNEEYAEYVGVAYYMYSAIGGYWAGTDGNVYGEIGIIYDPTYWAPLPESPKTEK